MIICTKRDGPCPHGMDCPYVDGENCTEQPKAPDVVQKPITIPTQREMNEAFYVDVCNAENRLKEFIRDGRKLLDSLPPHWHDDAVADFRDLCDETDALLNPRMHTPRQVEQATKRYGREPPFAATALTTERAARERAEAELAKAREVLEPFAEASRRFDAAAIHFNTVLPPDEGQPRTKFTHAQLRAARAFLEPKPFNTGGER